VQGRVALALVAGLALIAVALTIGLFAVANGIRDRGAGDTISVTGAAKRSISSDYLIWDASLSVQRETAAAAAAQLGRWLERTLAALRASGIQENELTVAAISTESVRGRSGKLTGYHLTRSFQVRSARLDVVVAAIEDSSQLLAADVPLSAGQPQYVYTKLAELRPALSADATKDPPRRGDRRDHRRRARRRTLRCTPRPSRTRRRARPRSRTTGSTTLRRVRRK
jgi:hypothetical protein